MRDFRSFMTGALAGAAATAGLQTALRYRREMGEQVARLESASSIAQTRCGPIEYAIAGSGAPLLIAHGAADHANVGRPVDVPRQLVAHEGLDALGAKSFFPADGTNSRALVKFDDGLAATNAPSANRSHSPRAWAARSSPSSGLPRARPR